MFGCPWASCIVSTSSAITITSYVPIRSSLNSWDIFWCQEVGCDQQFLLVILIALYIPVRSSVQIISIGWFVVITYALYIQVQVSSPVWFLPSHCTFQYKHRMIILILYVLFISIVWSCTIIFIGIVWAYTIIFILYVPVQSSSFWLYDPVQSYSLVSYGLIRSSSSIIMVLLMSSVTRSLSHLVLDCNNQDTHWSLSLSRLGSLHTSHRPPIVQTWQRWSWQVCRVSCVTGMVPANIIFCRFHWDILISPLEGKMLAGSLRC